MRWNRIVLSLLFVSLAAGIASAGDVLSEYQARYTKAPYDSAREELVTELAATGKPEALKALQWCQAQAKAALDDARDKSEKAQAKLLPIRAKYEQVFHQWAADEKKRTGVEPDVTKPPVFPEYDDFLKASSDVQKSEKRVIVAESLLQLVLDLYGGVVAKLSPEAQKAISDDWTKTRLTSKDWGVRAELYEILGHTPTPWALDMSLSAVTTEADARALGMAIDALSGKDAAKVTGPLVSRIDDVRWLVRAAVVSALEMTPSKEGIDAVVKRMQKEDGRLRDDCARALRNLTGGKIAAIPEMWRVYWEGNREKWAGKPPAPDPNAPPPIFSEKDPSGESARKTGFFGLQIESKRVVFVIDVSGSMTWEMGGSGSDAKTSRAARAKEELKSCLTALEDGVQFNVIFFSAGVRVWKPEMQKADIKTRKEAREFVDAAEVMGGTNTYDALEAAFGLGDMGKGKKRESDPTGEARVDTIVFLSDGKPSLGRTTDPKEIRAAVKDWNKARRIAIHSIAFGVAGVLDKAHEGADPGFMKGLADDTGGTYIAK